MGFFNRPIVPLTLLNHGQDARATIGGDARAKLLTFIVMTAKLPNQAQSLGSAGT